MKLNLIQDLIYCVKYLKCRNTGVLLYRLREFLVLKILFYYRAFGRSYAILMSKLVRYKIIS